MLDQLVLGRGWSGFRRLTQMPEAPAEPEQIKLDLICRTFRKFFQILSPLEQDAVLLTIHLHLIKMLDKDRLEPFGAEEFEE